MPTFSSSIVLGLGMLCAVALPAQTHISPVGVAHIGAHDSAGRQNTAFKVPSFIQVDSTTPKGHRHIVEGMLIGGAVGVAGGLVVASHESPKDNGFGNYVYLGGALAGGLIGIVIGGIAGIPRTY